MYSIAIKIEGIESRRRSTSFLHIILGFFLILKSADYYRYLKYQGFFFLVPFFAVASFSLFYGFFRRKVDFNSSYNFWLRLIQAISFLILGVLLVRVGSVIDYSGIFIFSFLCFLLVFSERKIFQDTYLTMDENGIKIPGYYKDHFVFWSSLSNVVVREDYITLFHKKDKFLQYQIMQQLTTLELAKMNAFCKEKIEQEVTTGHGISHHQQENGK